MFITRMMFSVGVVLICISLMAGCQAHHANNSDEHHVIAHEREVESQVRLESDAPESIYSGENYELRLWTYVVDQGIHNLAVIIGEGEYLISEPHWSLSGLYGRRSGGFGGLIETDSDTVIDLAKGIEFRKVTGISHERYLEQKQRTKRGFVPSEAVFVGPSIEMKQGLNIDDYEIEHYFSMYVVPLRVGGLRSYDVEIEGAWREYTHPSKK